MAEIVTEIRVFVASPGDVGEERAKLREIIEEVNRGMAAVHKIVLRLVTWQSDSFPDIGEDAQDVINRQIGEFDILLGIMWKRIGTPTKRFPSGTIEEFEQAYRMKKKYGRPYHILFYFKNAPFYLSDTGEVDQFKKVLQFKERYRDLGLFWEYTTADEFNKAVKGHLEKVIVKIADRAGESDHFTIESRKISELLSPYKIPIIDVARAGAPDSMFDLIKPSENLIVTGEPTVDKLALVETVLRRKQESLTLDLKDIVYVYNFSIPERPVCLLLPAGQGMRLRKSLQSLMEQLFADIPRIFKSEVYRERRREIFDRLQDKQRALLAELEKKINSENFALIQVQVGSITKPAILPVFEGTPVNVDQLQTLLIEGKISQSEVDEIGEKQNRLTADMESVFDYLKQQDDDIKETLKSLDRDVVVPLIQTNIAQIKAMFKLPGVSDYLAGLEDELVDHFELFNVDQKEIDLNAEEYVRFKANLLVNNAHTAGFPIVKDVAPDEKSLLGSIEYDYIKKQSHFLHIIPGAFYQAYGGFLILNGNDKYMRDQGLKIIKRGVNEGGLPRIPYTPGFMLWPQQPDWNVTLVMYLEYKSLSILLEEEVEIKNIFPKIIRIV
jgi:hypothetical protein